ncbi:MAG: dicarboxylate/amino acid:cation symporter [Clostridia bacterium]|nr:dicarboxylate/amino acid:cation symporter [Clostridia bacterium]
MKSYSFDNKTENIAKALDFVRDNLEECKVKIRNFDEDFKYFRGLLEYIATEHRSTEKIKINIYKRVGTTYIQLFFDGEELNIDKLLADAIKAENADAIDNIEAGRMSEVFRTHFKSKHFHHKYSHNVNTFTFVIQPMQHKSLVVLLACLLSGVAFGLGAKWVLPAVVTEIISEDLLTPIANIFVKCIKMIIGPLIFFTIGSSISGYTDLSSLGRMGRKMSGRYIVNAVIALVLATGITMIFHLGAGSTLGSGESVEKLLGASSGLVETASSTNVTLRDTIMNIFPSNFFKAFTESNILQIIFISFLLGIATAMIPGKYREGVCSFLNAGNAVFSKMVSIVMLLLPISVFCSMANAMISMGLDTLLMIATWLIALMAAFALMSVIYLLLIWKSTGIKPKQYLVSYSEALIATFAMGSCNSSMPIRISKCEEKLGVKKQIASFAIPIGGSLHCASNCIFYTISLIFLANLYSPVEINPLANMMIFLSILLLGIGAPSVSGSGPICVAVLLSSMGMPMGLITLIIGLDPFVSMFKSASSAMEDSYVALALAKSENMLDFRGSESDA